MSEDVVLPFPEAVLPVRHMRSTIILTSLLSLRDAGQFDRYAEALPLEHHGAVLNAVAGVWIDVAHAAAHYAACDTLGLSSERQMELGRETFARTKGAIYGTSVQLAQTAGVTPWSVLPHFQRFWLRGLDGGGVQVVKLGPKEADISVRDCSLVRIAYFRNAMRGIVTGMLALFCRQAYLRELPSGRAPRDLVGFRAQWA